MLIGYIREVCVKDFLPAHDIGIFVVGLHFTGTQMGALVILVFISNHTAVYYSYIFK